MDTKLKSNSLMKKIITTVIVLALIITSSIVFYSQYNSNEEKTSQDIKDFFLGETNPELLYDINEFNYGLYYETLKLDSNIDPLKIMIKDFGPQHESEANIKLYNINNYLKSSYQNLKYYALDNKTNQSVSNDSELKHLLDNNSPDNITKSLSQKYPIRMVINFDNDGNFTLVDASTENPKDVNTLIKNYKQTAHSILQEVETNPIRNMTYVYAYPSIKNLYNYDNISHRLESVLYNSNRYYAESLVVWSIVFIGILALLFPYKYLKELILFDKIIKLPFEVFPIALFISIGLFLDISSELIGDEMNIFSSTVQGSSTHILFYFLEFLILFIIFSMAKHILHTGIFKYLKEKSIIVKFMSFILKKLRGALSILSKVDLKNRNQKLLIIMVLGNLIIVSILCAFWLFGIALAVIYSILLFIFATKQYIKICEDYNKLLKGTKIMVQGDLSSFKAEDMGIFNSLRDDLQNIEKGFKKAVDLEVQSQKMKTELISNVSHDLKTPLTAIISYIDLLKEEDISPDVCKEYIDTIDKKSQRLKYLIEDLFEVSKANSGNISLNLMDVDVVSLMKQTLIEQEHNIEGCGIKFKTSYPKEKVILSLDNQRTFRVFENLIVNITKYGLENSRAYIEVVDNDSNVEIVLKNISREELDFKVDEIVERFVRGDKSRNTEGSGLGLAIAKSFVELQGGTFDISIDGDLFKVNIVFTRN